jgi:hypothetical protein
LVRVGEVIGTDLRSHSPDRATPVRHVTSCLPAILSTQDDQHPSGSQSGENLFRAEKPMISAAL